MEDAEIVALYFARDEQAIVQTQQKYDRYCRYIAENILSSDEDVEECLNDAYHKAWNTIPPQAPTLLSGYLGMLTRQIAFDRYRENRRVKRGGGELALVLDELQDCIEDRSMPSVQETAALQDTLNRFFMQQPSRTRIVFLQRYWYGARVENIARSLGMSQAGVNTLLCRTRKKLKKFLEKEGIRL